MKRIDRALADLGKAPPPFELAGIEARVWRRIAVTNDAGLGWRVPAAAMVSAMLVGMMASPQPARTTNVADMDALSVRPALLPSTLLASS